MVRQVRITWSRRLAIAHQPSGRSQQRNTRQKLLELHRDCARRRVQSDDRGAAYIALMASAYCFATTRRRIFSVGVSSPPS